MAMAASAPPAEFDEDPGASQASVAAEQLARIPNASVIAHETSTNATRVEATGEALLLKAQPAGSPAPVVFLLVGGAFSYPIVHDAIAMLDGNRVLFPTPGQGLSIILQPVNADDALWDAFVSELASVCTVRRSPAAIEAGGEEVVTPTSTWGDTVATGMRTVGAAAAFGLVKGAKYAGYGISKVGAFAKSRMSKNEQETEVSEETKERLEKARVISHAAMHVTGGLIEGVTNVAMTLGSAFAGAIKDTDAGKKVQAGAQSSTGQELRKVAGAGVHAFANIWNALELSARTVGKATSDATVDVMEHKYGKQAADATRQGFSAAGGAALSVFHVSNIAATSVATYTSSHGDKEHIVTRKQLRDAQSGVKLPSDKTLEDAPKK